jgi:uncharacterized membrane protein YkvI
MNINEPKHLLIGFSGSNFLLYFSTLDGLETMVARIAHYGGLIGGLILTIVGISNYLKDAKLKNIQLKKEAVELEIRQQQLKQVKLLDDDTKGSD